MVENQAHSQPCARGLALVHGQQQNDCVLQNSALAQVPFHTGTEAVFGRQYYVFMQYSRFVRHGYTILESPLPELALVAASPRSDARRTFVVVVTNPLPREEV